MKKCLITYFLLVGTLISITAAETKLDIVKDGKSKYVIYYGEGPASVKKAAKELQIYIRKSTGAVLPIAAKASYPMICLGINDELKKSGLDFSGIPEEGFRINTRGENIYIYGKDDVKQRWAGYLSKGTLFGLYTFLEKYVGIRWLMPGFDGIYIPGTKNLSVAVTPEADAPFFESRSFPGRVSRNWCEYQRLGGLVIKHNHVWDTMLSPRRKYDFLRQHPEFLAMQKNGKRVTLPKDGTRWYGKFCTTNPQFVDAVADSVCNKIKKSKVLPFSETLSPSDFSGWCECAECRKYRETCKENPAWGSMGCFRSSVTPLLLKFYNDVAKIVGKKYPHTFVVGYIYFDYTYPPANLKPLEPNVALMLAPMKHYGMTRFKPKEQEEFERLCKAWSGACKLVGYYGASTWMMSALGTPFGPSSEILEHTFRTIAKNKFKAVYYYYLPWSFGALHNYLAAKLMWNPHADIQAITRDFLKHAYGEKPAVYMEQMYRLLDDEMKKYKVKQPEMSTGYVMTTSLALDVYAKNFWEIEKLYSQALKSCDDPNQRKRLEMFGDNLYILHHVLLLGKALVDAEKSMFYLDSEKYKDFLKKKKDSDAVRAMAGAAKHGAITGLFRPGKKIITVPRVKTPPTIDGVYNDAAWRGTIKKVVVRNFTKAGDKGPAKERTTALMAFDDKNLYLYFRCNDTKIVGRKLEKDDFGIFKGDCVEFFFAVDPNRPKSYWHLVVNPENSQWDAFERRLDENLKWESKVRKFNNNWTVEIKIPFKSLHFPGTDIQNDNMPVPGMSWRVNMAREDQPSKEISTWAPVEKAFGNPNEFGQWIFP